MAAPTCKKNAGSKACLSIADVLEAINRSDSEFDELSSGDETSDEWPAPNLTSVGMRMNPVAVMTDFSDGEPLTSSKKTPGPAPRPDKDQGPKASIATKVPGSVVGPSKEQRQRTSTTKKTPAPSKEQVPKASTSKKTPTHGKEQGPKAKKAKKVDHTFEHSRPFVPPPDIKFVDVVLVPEPRKDVSPYGYFKRFVTDDMFSYLADETNSYAHQKSGINIRTSANEIETFTGMYFHMGLVQMPSVGCYWESDTRYQPVVDMMSRNRFQKITSYLHIKNNLLVTDLEKQDRAWKIRQWLADLNENFAKVSPDKNQSVDEIMVAFKGRSLLKQYLPKKTKKWGFKLWARCAASGFLHVFDIYQGKGTGMGDDDELSNCGLGGNVVLKLCSSLPEKHNFKIFADNYFSNLAMVHELRQRDLFYVGTINNNRLHGAPLKSEKQLKKEGRGAIDTVVETTANISLVRWFDNKCVTVVSSYLGAEPLDVVRRYDRSKKEYITVRRPYAIGAYNMSMGGVDLLDMMCSLYKYLLRSKRWYLYIFYHTLTIALVNAWFVYRRDCKVLAVTKPMPLRKFQAYVATALCNSGKPLRGRPSLDALLPAKKKKVQVNPSPVGDVRFDGLEHFSTYEEKRQRCRNCPDGFAYVRCAKCKVHLCLNKSRNCFTTYHRR